MNEILINKLTAYGYQRARLSINNGAVFARTAGTAASVLLYVEEPQGLRGQVEQFAAVRNTVVDAFHRSGFSDVKCLMMIESWRVPELGREEEKLAPVWFIEQSGQRLMIYENSVSDFDGLKTVVERALWEIQGQSGTYANQRAQSVGGQSYDPYAGQQTGGQYYSGQQTGGQYYSGQPNAAQPKAKRTNGMQMPRNFKEFVAHQGLMNLSIVAINILVFIVMEIIGDTEDAYFMAYHGALYTPWVMQGEQLYTLVTSMFLHFGIAHLFGNMLILFFLGDNLERAVGHAKYLIIYFGAGLAGNLTSCLIETVTGDYAIGAGASGAIFGVVGALLLIVIRNRNHLEDLSTWKLALFIGYTLYSGFTSSGVDNAAHVGGLLAGVLLAAILYRKKKTSIPS